MTYLLISIVAYYLIILCFFSVFNCRRNRNDPEDTRKERFITALLWPPVALLLGIIYVMEVYYTQKRKYDTWRWRVRQEKKRRTDGH